MAKIKGIISKRLPKGQWAEAQIDENGIQTGYIVIDPKCKGIKDLEMVNHEGLHILCPWLSEDAVRIIASELTKAQWGRMYRRIDADESTPLQDREHGLEGDDFILDGPDVEPPLLNNIRPS